MNKLFVVLLIITCSARTLAQDCTNAADCLAKGINSNFESQAFEYLNKALKLSKKEGTNPSEIYFNRGIKFYNKYTPDLKEAESDFKNAIKADPKSFWPHMWLASLYGTKQEDYKKANTYLEEVMNKFPNDPRVFYQRAHNHRFHRYDALAATDFEMAYNLMLDDASLLDENSRADIVRWHAEMYMRGNKIIIADENTVNILEAGYKLVPNNAKVIGDLVLAYYDTDQIQKAEELAPKANEINKSNSGGSLCIAMKSLENKEYFKAANLMHEAENAMLHSHPMIYYWLAQTKWQHIYNEAKNQWANNKAFIKNRLELTIQYGQGTKYDYLAKHAKEMIAIIDSNN